MLGPLTLAFAALVVRAASADAADGAPAPSATGAAAAAATRQHKNSALPQWPPPQKQASGEDSQRPSLVTTRSTEL